MQETVRGPKRVDNPAMVGALFAALVIPSDARCQGSQPVLGAKVVPAAAAPADIGSVNVPPGGQIPESPNQSGSSKLPEQSKSQESPFDLIFKIGIGVIAFVAAVRGVGKLVWSGVKNARDRADFLAGRSLSAPATNMHSFVSNPAGFTELHINTVHQPVLDDIFRSPYAAELFKALAKLTTEERPFPLLQYGKSVEPNRVWGWLTRGPLGRFFQPRPSAIFLKHQFDQLFVEYSSRLHGRGVFGLEGGAEVKAKVYYFIPVVETKTAKRRDLLFRMICQDNFERLGNPSFVAGLREANPHHRGAIDQLRRAYQFHRRFLERSQGRGQTLPPGHAAAREPGETLFPWVRLYLPNGHRAPELH